MCISYASFAPLLLGLFAAAAWPDTLAQVNSPSDQNSSDSINWSQLGPDQTILVASFHAASVNGATVGVSLAAASSIVSQACGTPHTTVRPASLKPASTSACSWTGGDGFAGGDTLLWAANTANGGNGPVTLAFGTAIWGAGALIQANVPGQFTAQVQAFNGTTSLGSFTVNSDAAGDAVYIGLMDETGSNITSVVFSLTACGATALGSDDCNDFGLDTVYLNTVAAGTPSAVSITPNPSDGPSQTFALLYSDTSGNASLNAVAVIFNTTVTSQRSCYAYYASATNRLYLQNDSGSGATFITPGSGTLSNSQCAITGSGTSVVKSGNNLTLNLAVIASGSFAGPKNVYMYARNNSSAYSGWVDRGVWTPSSSFIPSAVSVMPTPASGASQAFALKYSDTGGNAAFTSVAALFNATLSSKSSCYVYYVPQTNLLYLQNDDGVGATSLTLGSGTLSNSQCTINGSGTSVMKSPGSNTLTLNLALTGIFTGTKQIFMKAADDSSANSGWVDEGTWTP